MRYVRHAVCVLLVGLACAGCAPSNDDVEDRALRTKQEQARQERQVADLRGRIANVTEENTILVSRIGELRTRANSLSRRAGDLKFIVDQQEKQILALKEIIVELRRRLAGPAATMPTGGTTRPAPPPAD